MDLRKLQRVIVDALDDIKAQDIQVFNTIGQTELFDRVIVATASSNRQTRALAAHVRDKVKAAGGQVVSVEGEESGEWVLVDLGDAVVHIMQPAIRAYYRLEELWGAKPVSLKVGPVKKTAAPRTGQQKRPSSSAGAAPTVGTAQPAKRGAATGAKRGATASDTKKPKPTQAALTAGGERTASSPATRASASKRAAPSSAAPASASPRSPRASAAAAPAKPATRTKPAAARSAPSPRAARPATPRAGKRTGST